MGSKNFREQPGQMKNPQAMPMTVLGRSGRSGVTHSDSIPCHSQAGYQYAPGKIPPHTFQVWRSLLAPGELCTHPQCSISDLIQAQRTFCQLTASFLLLDPLWPFWNFDLQFQGKNRVSKRDTLNFTLQKVQSFSCFWKVFPSRENA